MSPKKPTKTKPSIKASPTRHQPPRRRLLARLAILFILIALMPVPVALVIHLRASEKEAALYPPLGELVNMGDFSLHLYCTGNRPSPETPTVILEAGVPGWSLHWQAVQSKIAARTRVCSYDRAGYGWSEKGPAPRTLQNIVGELNALLNAAQETGPYLLVGHSLGGPIALAYQNAFPDQVKGIVLVDAWGPELFSPTPGVIKNTMSLVDTLRTMARFGIVRLAGEIGFLSLDEQLQANLLPEQFRPVYRSAYYQEKFWDTWHRELQAFEENARLIASFHSLNNLPLQVIQAGKRAPNDYPSDKIWNQVQQSLAALSNQGKLVTAEKSGHFIQLEQPEAVLQAIQEVLAAIQK